jgi:filamentous hemagglutinin family protein
VINKRADPEYYCPSEFRSERFQCAQILGKGNSQPQKSRECVRGRVSLDKLGNPRAGRSLVVSAMAMQNLTQNLTWKRWNSLMAAGLGGAIATTPALAQIPPNISAGDLDTTVTQTGNQYLIQGGQLSGDAANLFHSFDRFSLLANDVAEFNVANPAVRAVFGRVLGANPSIIDGTIRLIGAPANLYLMNPAGIVFGPGAQLAVPASFTATTAAGIGFGANGWFHATGAIAPGDYAALQGPPTAVAFQTPFLVGSPGGGIVNFGTLVAPGNLSMLGHVVLNLGTLAASGQVTVAAVPVSGPGGSTSSLVRISPTGSLLSFEVPAANLTRTLPQSPATLASLLTGGGFFPTPPVSDVVVDPLTGDVFLSSGGIVGSGDAAIRRVDAPEVTLATPMATTSDLTLLRDDFSPVSRLETVTLQAGGIATLEGAQLGKAAVTLDAPIAILRADTNGSPLRAGDITVNAVDASLIGVIGDRITLNATGFTFLNRVSALSLATDAAGLTVLSDGLSTVGDQLYRDAVFLGGSGTLQVTSTAGSIQFLNTVQKDIEVGPDRVELTAASSLVLGGPVGVDDPSANPIAEWVATASDIQVRGTIAATAQTYNGPVTVGSPNPPFAPPTPTTIKFYANNGSLVFNDALRGALRLQELKLDTATGAVVLAQGAQVADALRVVSGTVELGGNVVSGGDQIYQADVWVRASNMIFDTAAGQLRFERDLTPIDTAPVDLTLRLGVGQLQLLDTDDSALKFRAIAINAASPFSLENTLITNGGPVSIQAQRIDGSGQILTQGGDITLDSATTLDATGIALNTTVAGAPSGDIRLLARGDLRTGDVQTRSTTSAGGDIQLTSETGTITTENLRSAGVTAGGDITVQARTAIDTGAIDTSASLGDGGDVLLDPLNDITVAWINAQGGSLGAGGDIDITTGRYFRATGSFVDRNRLAASLSTAGGLDGGDITLRHNGGLLGTPFQIGDATLNGTAGVITTGLDNTLPLGASYPYLFVQGQIQLVTLPAPVLADPIKPIPIEQTPPIAELPPWVELDADLEPPGFNSDAAMANSFGPLDLGVESVDADFGNDFGDYLGLDGTLSLSYQEIHKLAMRVEADTGRRPAFVYISFAPVGDVQSTPPAAAKDANAKDANAKDAKVTGAAGAKSGPARDFQQASDRLELLVVTATGKLIRRVVYDAPRQVVMPMVAAFQEGVIDRTSEEYLAPAQQLYKWLIAPIEADLQAREIDNLLFLMDGGLRSLPMAALHDGKQFLVEKYSLGMAPSLSLVDTRPVNIKNARLLAMGASQFKAQDPLPAVPVELSLVSQLFTSGQPLLNETFTIDNLQTRRRQASYGILHLATHGEFKPGAPEESYIQFWDSRLTMDQIRSLGLSNPPLELLVLSACRTALGDEKAELGFAGLAAQAGVKTALASLWYVSDEGTLALMTEFYDRLRHPQVGIKAEALQQAQLAMLHGKVKIDQGFLKAPALAQPLQLPAAFADWSNENLTHPYYWAAFTMIGNPW